MKRLSNFLNVVAFFQIVLGLLLGVAVVWTCKEVFYQLLFTDILLFLLVVFIWLVLCKDKEEAEK